LDGVIPPLLRTQGFALATPCDTVPGAPMDRDDDIDISLTEIARAIDRIDPAFLGTPQGVSDALSDALGREIIVKNETETPIGSFKGRGTWLLAEQLDLGRTWVCSTAGNFGQGLAYAARARGAFVHAFVSPDVPAGKQAGMRALGATVELAERPGASAHAYAADRDDRLLVLDGQRPAMAEGAGTIAVELTAGRTRFDLVIVQVGDGALITGMARWLKATDPPPTIIGVCAAGAPAMARSYDAGRIVTTDGTDTIATALAITDPVPEALTRVRALVDGIVLVDDGQLRTAQRVIDEQLGVAVEPAGAAGLAALTVHRSTLPPGRTALILTGAAQETDP
jgi:threonine dehydratase